MSETPGAGVSELVNGEPATAAFPILSAPQGGYENGRARLKPVLSAPD